MLEGININARVNFTYSKDVDVKTEIILKPLSSFDMLALSPSISAGDYGAMIIASVVEIKNPDITEANKIKEYLASLKIEIITELMEKVNSINNLTDDEQKN